MLLRKLFINLLLIIVVGLALKTGAETETLLITVPVTQTSPLIDGVLEDMWNSTPGYTNFVQLIPNEGRPVSEKTEVFFLQDHWALYAGFRCETIGRSPDAREGSRGNREGDFVVFYLDTFRDKRSAYYFGVNAAGVQFDGILSEDGLMERSEWEGVFYSMTELYDSGYTVEIAIPWESMKCPVGAIDWGFNVERSIPLNSEQAFLIPVKQDEGLHVSRFGLLSGLEPAHKNKGLKLYPSIFFRTENSFSEVTNETQPAVDVNYSPRSWLTLQNTVNPDFSQIEADPFKLNLSKYNLFFNERRLFFVEEAEFFQPSGGFMADLLDIFYSRQIGRKLSNGSEVPLQFGSRMTAKHSGWTLGILGAATNEVEYNDFLGQAATEDAARFLVARANRQVLTSSSIGVMYAGKLADAIDNQAASVDATYSTPKIQVSGQLAFADYDGLTDRAGQFYVKYNTRQFSVRASALDIGDKFDVSEIGFVPWMGTKLYSITAGPNIYPKSGPLTFGQLKLSANASRELGETKFAHDFAVIVNAAFRNGWGAGASYTGGSHFELDQSYNPAEIGMFIQSDVSRRFWVIFNASNSYSYNYRRDYFAQSMFLSYYISWSFSDRASFSNNGTIWLERTPDNGIAQTTYRLRPGLIVTIINGMSVSLYQETVVTKTAGVRQLRLGLSFTYNFLPKSWLDFAVSDWQMRENDSYRLMQRVFAAKIRHMMSW